MVRTIIHGARMGGGGVQMGFSIPVNGNRSTRTQATRPGQLAPRTQDNSHPTMSQPAPDSMLRAYCFRKTMLIVWYMPLCVH